MLTASSEAIGFVGSASGLGQSHFVGNSLDVGWLTLVLNFDNLNSGRSGDMFVLLTNSISGQLANDDITSSGAKTYSFFLALGGVTTLDITVLSEASAAAPGTSASNFSQASISGTIPLPATPFLAVAGLGAMLISRRRHATAEAA